VQVIALTGDWLMTVLEPQVAVTTEQEVDTMATPADKNYIEVIY